jgi:hypothetical protein
MLPARAMSEDEQRFELLADLGAMIAREVELDELLASCADRVARAIGAERATLWVVDGATGELRARLADALELDELRLPVGRGVAGTVARTGEAVMIADAARDPRWHAEIDQRTGYTTRSMLCVPVRGPDATLRGVLQVLNHKGGGFADRDRAFASALADQIGRALEFTTLRGHFQRPGVAVRGRYNHVVGQRRPTPRCCCAARRAPARACSRARSTSTRSAKPAAGACRRHHAAGAARRERALRPRARRVHRRRRGACIGKVERHRRHAVDRRDRRPAARAAGQAPALLQEREFERVGGGRASLSSDARGVCDAPRPRRWWPAGQFRRTCSTACGWSRSPSRRCASAAPTEIAAAGGALRRACTPSATVARSRVDPARARTRSRARWPGNVRELEHWIESAVVLARLLAAVAAARRSVLARIVK